MTIFSILLFNRLDVITSVTPIYYYVLMVMSALIYIGISLFVFNSIQRSLKTNSKKI